MNEVMVKSAHQASASDEKRREAVSDYLRHMFGLEGRVAVVIGGGGHLCSAMAAAMAQAGCAVAVADLRPHKAEAVEAQLKDLGCQRTLAVGLDATSREQHVAALDHITGTLGGVDILVNGAGINGPTPFLEIELDEWRAILDSQLTATFLGCQVFGRHMLERSRGSIINISSASANPALSKAFTYSVAKAGIVNLTQNLGREWGTRGVRVNALRPGFFPTEWNRKNFITAEREAAILGHTPMRRYGEPSELAGAALWLASDAASFVTGAEIAVDGGFSCMTV
jgi:NAD(P)-dependent dehydrogenase (short-subunit alcohol dehydrogenase family)